MSSPNKERLFIAGHNGMVGSALLRLANQQESRNTITRSRDELDLCDKDQVFKFFETERPSQVILAAAKVGGIVANNEYRTEFITQNLSIQNNVIMAAHEFDVQDLVFLGSTCIYPKNCPQPIKESYLHTGKLELTNRPYAIAKLAGVELISSIRHQYGKNFFSVMPTNLYGPGDNFDLKTSHVLPALIRKFLEAKANGAKSVSLWGSGTPKREFLHVDDCAAAVLHLLDNVTLNTDFGTDAARQLDCHINLGSGQEYSIMNLGKLIAKSTEFNGTLEFDRSKPDGTPRKLVDATLLKDLGWQPEIDFESGLANTIKWYLANH
ncbi:MAG: GDP-L-fucose synthase [Pseudobacteriovorax sp.]|nr:GDP-L-fucose synthase [Pseudobacteriovorax sp.]